MNRTKEKSKVVKIKRVEKSVLEILREFNNKNLEKNIIQAPKHKTYRLLVDKFEHFLKTKNLEALAYKDFDYSLLDEAFIYLKNTRFDKKKAINDNITPVQNDTLRPLMQFLARGNKYARDMKYTKTTLPEYDRMKSEANETPFLVWHEVESLENLDLSKSSEIEGIRDVFLFACYTGFLYADIRKFDYKQHIEIDKNGKEWIIKPREKNSNRQNLPFIDKAKAILVKWKYDLPLQCDQIHNRQIKQLCKTAGITKVITNMCGRKTAGMIWLDMGYSMPSVSSMLGHRSIKVTEKHYAHVQRSRITHEKKIIDANNRLLENQTATAPALNKDDLMLEILQKLNISVEKLANK